MKQIKCVNCSDTISIPDRGETILNGETPLEHIERTGHPHVREPRSFVCNDCDYLWMYSGESETPSCPNCKGKNTTQVGEENNE